MERMYRRLPCEDYQDKVASNYLEVYDEQAVEAKVPCYSHAEILHSHARSEHGRRYIDELPAAKRQQGDVSGRE